MIATSEVDICNMALGYLGVNKPISALTDNSPAAIACSTYYAQTRDQLLSLYRWPLAIRRAQLTPYAGSAYDAAHAYAAGDMASFGNTVYRSLQAANTGHEPDLATSAAWWAQITRDGWTFACPLPSDFIEGIAIWEKPTQDVNASIRLFDTAPPPPFRNPRSDQRIAFAIEDANDGSGLPILLTDVDTPILQYVAEITNSASFWPLFVNALAWRLASALVSALRGIDPKYLEITAKAGAMALAEAISACGRGMQEDAEPLNEFSAARES